MPYDERDEESGQFRPEYTDEDFLEAINAVNVATTSAVGEHVGCKYRTAYARLQRLEEDGLAENDRVGNTLVWSRTDDGDDAVADHEHGARERREPAATPSPVEDDRTDLDAGESDHDAGGGLEGLVAGLEEFPSTREPTEAADVVRAVRDYLRAEGPASMREIVNAVMPEHPLGYDIPDLPLEPGDRYRGAWWRRIVQPALVALEDVEYRDGYSDYRYIGDDVAGHESADSGGETDE